MKRYFEYTHTYRSRGMTLIELLIVLMMISFVLFIGYSLYFLGIKSFTTGMDRSDAQFECRKAMEFITKEVQTAYNGTVYLDNTNSNTDGYKYIYIDTVTTNPTYGMLMYDNGVNDPVVKAGIADKVIFTSITFSAPTQGILRVSLTAEGSTNTNTQSFDLSSDIKLLNYSSFNPDGSFPSESYSVLEVRP